MSFSFVLHHLHYSKSCLSEKDGCQPNLADNLGFCQCAGARRQNDPLGLILSF